jgi:anti-anti-sigma regulatory factor
VLIKGTYNSLTEINDLVAGIGRIIPQFTKDELTLDLSQCESLPSSIMGFLVHWHKDLTNKKKSLILESPPNVFLELLKVCNLDSTFNIKTQKKKK